MARRTRQQRAPITLPENTPGHGRNKSAAKKREYKEHCRVMRRSGYVVDYNGNWTDRPANLRLSEAAVRGTTAK